MIDVDTLAQLAPPHGEGTVALRTSLFLELLAEVKELRRCLVHDVLDPTGPTSLTDEDREMLASIQHAVRDGDSRDVPHLLHEYYRDADRADRTPRAVLYIHIGILVGALSR